MVELESKAKPTLEVEKCLREVARSLRNAEYETRTNKTLQTAKIMQTLCSLRMEIVDLEKVLRSGVSTRNIVRMPSKRYLQWADAALDCETKDVLAERRARGGSDGNH